MQNQTLTAEQINNARPLAGRPTISGLGTLDVSPALNLLFALERSGKPIYRGTVPTAEKARRRAENKRARAARKVNR